MPSPAQSDPARTNEQIMEDIVKSAKAVGFAECLDEVITIAARLSGTAKSQREFYVELLDSLEALARSKRNA